jgi:ferrochelatase
MKKGVLLINLGSPDEPTPKAVGRYLNQFLMDPMVIDIPTPLRWLLVKGIIVPFRKGKSAHAYQQVWKKEGSPLVLNSRDLLEKVRKDLGSEYHVAMGMRYGNPSIEAGLTELKYAGVSSILAIPLYPQYAASSTETAVLETMQKADSLGIAKLVSFIEPFYENPGYVAAVAATIENEMKSFQSNHLLFSFHGLPIKAVVKSCDLALSCLPGAGGCPSVGPSNKNCYRAHCYATARAVAQKLGLDKTSFSVGFQSRLTSRWIEPFTDTLLEEFAKRGVKKLLVACPSFVADCLETLEEIQMRAKEDFLAFGGQELRLVPSLNSNPDWVDSLSSQIKKSL